MKTQKETIDIQARTIKFNVILNDDEVKKKKRWFNFLRNKPSLIKKGKID